MQTSNRDDKSEIDYLSGAVSKEAPAVDYEKEFREFVYIVSHDLTAPARHLKQFTQLLCRRIEDKLEPEEREFTDIMLKSADRMQDMLAALLTFSRLLGKENSLSTFDMKKLVSDTGRRFPEIKEQEARVLEIGQLGSITANKEQIEYVIEQLIDNAIKFSREGVAHQVRIYSSPMKGGKKFVVSDNGIGIERDQREQAFRFFQRLNGEAYAGPGVGLAISRKMIELHGGQMWIADAPQGTSVVFTLPDPAVSD